MISGGCGRNPRVGDFTYIGYNIVEEWRDLRLTAIWAVAAVTVALSFIFRQIFGDWQTAIGTSSLIVAALALVVQWAMYTHDQD